MGRPTGSDAGGQAVPDALLLRQMTDMVGQSRIMGSDNAFLGLVFQLVISLGGFSAATLTYWDSHKMHVEGI